MEVIPLGRSLCTAGRPTNRILLADAMRISPSSSAFRERIMASYRYGLTDGNYNSETIALTAIGTAATRPRDDNERVAAEREAFSYVPVFAQLLEHFANKLPEPQFLKNTLEREPFSIEPTWSSEVATIFEENARAVGYLRNTSGGSSYLVIEAGTAPAPEVRKEECMLSPRRPMDHRSPSRRRLPSYWTGTSTRTATSL